MTEKIHMGELIEKQLKQKGQSKVWLADKLGCERNNIYRLLKRPHIDIYLLIRIREILNHDFFKYYCNTCKNNEL